LLGTVQLPAPTVATGYHWSGCESLVRSARNVDGREKGNGTLAGNFHPGL